MDVRVMLRLSIVFFAVLLSCNVTAKYDLEKIENSKNLYLKTPKFSGVIFDPNTFTERISISNFTPTADEIYKAEEIFNNYLKTKKTDQKGVMTNTELIKPTSQYYRQYFGNIKSNGEKVIKLNCFHKIQANKFSWKLREVLVKDGGNAFFQVTVNITTGECYDFYVHGTA